MDCDDVIKILRSRQAELRAAGVEHLHLFGSAARGDQTPSSAIDLAAEMRDLAAEMRDLAAEMRDLAAEMSTANEWTLLTLGGVQIELIDWLGADGNLSLLSWFRPSLRERVLHGAVDAF